MTRRLRASALVAVALTAAAAPSLAQTRGGGERAAAQQPEVVAQSIAVPVFPGQLLSATLLLPSAPTPLPAVLLLSMREPGSAPARASVALADALLERGIAVVRLDLPPAPVGMALGAEPMAQPADDAFAVLQFVRDREDIDGDRVALAGVDAAARHAARAAGLAEGVRALVLLGAPASLRDGADLPLALPVLTLPSETGAAPAAAESLTSPVAAAAGFLARHLQ